jgi:hypothetical protein
VLQKLGVISLMVRYMKVSDKVLNVPNDFGEYHLPALFRSDQKNYKERVYYFITLEEWRERRIDDILN